MSRKMSDYIDELLYQKLRYLTLKRIVEAGDKGVHGDTVLVAYELAQDMRREGLVEFFHGRWYATAEGRAALAEGAE